MPTLAKENCTGCTACISVCPKQCLQATTDAFGFTYPTLRDPSTCIECGLCERTCPVLKKTSLTHQPIAYAAYSKNMSLRMESSSGGVFSELASRILEKGGVVYGAAYTDSFEIAHCCVDKLSDLPKLRGAKYAESKLGSTFSDILLRLNQGQYVLFAGTPCQVSGLKAFLKKEFETLLCVDFVCHGVPSPMAWNSYIHYRSKQDNDGKLPVSINLRSKDTGWSRYQYSNLFDYGNGTVHQCTSTNSLFMKLFVGDYISRNSCETCAFKGYARVSDITLGDFWGIWEIAPDLDDNHGTSVVLLQSSKAKALWKEMQETIVCREVSLEEASRHNLSMLQPSKGNAQRDFALKQLSVGNFDFCETLFAPKKPILRAKISSLKAKLVRKVSFLHR